MSRITASQREAFAADGVICVRGLIDASWVERLQRAVDEALGQPSADAVNMAAKYGRAGVFHVEVHVWRRLAFRRFLEESPAAAAAAELLSSREVRLYNDRLLVKEPLCGAPTEWHQDLPYFHFEGSQACAAWLSLDHVGSRSGGVQYIRGSHRWGRMYHAAGLDKAHAAHPDFSGQVEEIEQDLGRHDVIGFDLEPGDCLFHHPLVLHGAAGNADPVTRRRGYAVRFAGDDVTWKRRPYSRTSFPVDLRDGEPLRGEPFPKLWPRGAAAA